MVDEEPSSDKLDPVSTLTNNSFNHSTQATQSAARRRWKLLCLVKTSDTVADETARKEKIQERVDEWMSSMVYKMREEDVVGVCTTNGVGRLNPIPTNGSSGGGELLDVVGENYRQTKNQKDKKEDPHEQAQLERIRQRELAERAKEREMILSGKMSMESGIWKDDPVLKLQRDLDKVQRKVSRDQQHHQHQRKQKKSFTSGQASQSPVMSGVRLKWFSAMKGVGSKTLQSSKSDEDISTSDDSTETVVARLVYDEATDKLSRVNEDDLETKSTNPIFDAFKAATDVDDLYRIAEIWVNTPIEFRIKS